MQPQVQIPVVKNIIFSQKRGRIGLKIKGLENQIKRLHVGEDLHAVGGSTTIGNLSKSQRGRVGGSKTILGEMGWRTLTIEGWISVWMVSSLTGLGLIKQESMRLLGLNPDE